MKYDFPTLQNNMKMLRIFSENSQEYISAVLHISRSTYASYESGLHAPDLNTLQNFSILYHVSLSDLIYAPMEELILQQIHYKKNEAALHEALPLYEALSPLDKARIIERIDALKQEEELVLSLYHSCCRETGDQSET